MCLALKVATLLLPLLTVCMMCAQKFVKYWTVAALNHSYTTLKLPQAASVKLALSLTPLKLKLTKCKCLNTSCTTCAICTAKQQPLCLSQSRAITAAVCTCTNQSGRRRPTFLRVTLTTVFQKMPYTTLVVLLSTLKHLTLSLTHQPTATNA